MVGFREAAGKLLRRRAALAFEAPLRAELLGMEQLDRHARTLAAAHQVEVSRHGPELLLSRLNATQEQIRRCYRVVAQAAAAERRLAPAEEWLLDNFYLVEEQVQAARKHLPRGYSRELPRLTEGPAAGLPRVHDIALELISHTDGLVDEDHLSRFITAYQSVTNLTLGELWAVPIMLRLALIENVARSSYWIENQRRDRDLALEWAQRFIRLSRKHPKAMITTLADMLRDLPTLSQSLISELAVQLQGQHAALGLVLNYLEQELSDRGQSLESVLQNESQEQAGQQVSIGNSITSMRALGAIDWRDFTERLSATEAVLRQDPAGVHAAMDFSSRDQYRHVVEDLARHSQVSEPEVARLALRLAVQAAAKEPAGTAPQAMDRRSHLGYYLVDRGRPELEKLVAFRAPASQWAPRWIQRRPLLSYLGLIALGTLGLSAIVLAPLLLLVGFGPALLAAALLVLLAATRPAVLLTDHLITLIIPPRTLPRMDFRYGIPPEFPTLVIVPTLLSNRRAIEQLMENLELHYLANRDPNLYFALITDFPDADQQHLPQDQPLLDQATSAIDGLNQTYGEDRPEIFFLLHRARMWNPEEGRWMGRERKRGKIDDLNELIRHGDTSAFAQVIGETATLTNIRLVITLDSDTELPRETAWKLVGSLAHPLNRPEVDPRSGLVRQGYGLLQPRMSIRLVGATRSRFARLYAGEVGIDPYTRAASNVYHDLFGEGSFIGKGIYDVGAMSQCLHGRFPDNLILSHDLIEGCFARCGFVDDVELYEDQPSNYLADVSRRRRWARGDWQIIGYLLPRAPGRQRRQVNYLSGLSRWKILDNLRRSVAPAVMLALLAAGWALLPGWTWVWPLLVVGLFLLPWVTRTTAALLAKPPQARWRFHLQRRGRQQLQQLAQIALELLFLPYESWVYLDSIVRVSWRKLISRRRLLEWEPAADAERKACRSLGGVYRQMWPCPLLALLQSIALYFYLPQAGILLAPLLAGWLLAPALAWWLSQPLIARRYKFRDWERELLRSLARRTWRYFERFVDAEQNYLPPDNFQESPKVRLAERTSPTNIGLYLLSALAGWDLGYHSSGQLLTCIANTFGALENLERFRGHFYNWYNTRTGATLSPYYVSSVDSGNLSAHLHTLRGGLQEMLRSPVLSPGWVEGLQDTGRLLLQEMEKAGDHGPAAGPFLEQMRQALAGLQGPANSPAAARQQLGALAAHLSRLATQAPPPAREASWWFQALVDQCRGLLEELQLFFPWVYVAQIDLDLLARKLPALRGALAQTSELANQLWTMPQLEELAQWEQKLGPVLEQIQEQLPRDGDGVDLEQFRQQLGQWRSQLASASAAAAKRIGEIEDLSRRCGELADADYRFLYDPVRKLLAIGFHTQSLLRESSYYDLLASEARLASYLCVALGQLPQEHWFSLGRRLILADGEQVLVSWSGSMFEYLMPCLVLPNFQSTLLEQTCKAAVTLQIAYGRQQHVPWGISESGYNLVDRVMNYQYRAFGVPSLGLKRGLSDDLVIAPYASALALQVDPAASVQNLEVFVREGMVGPFGLYEAFDYTPERVPSGQKRALVQSYMAHHHGMSLLAITNALLNEPMPRRFLANAQFRAALPLLQEKVPLPDIATRTPAPAPLAGRARAAGTAEAAMRVYKHAETPGPEVHLLSNGRYHVVLSHTGGGFSRWQNLFLTRWREDAVRDHWGTFCYLQDKESRDTWSIAVQPTMAKAQNYEAIFCQGRVEYRRLDRGIQTHTVVSVSPEEDLEIRRITLTNMSDRPRTVQLTSYAEVVLLEGPAEAAHPAFVNLFTHTQILADKAAILCTRRPRTADERPPYLLHMLIPRQSGATQPQFETDRARFLGRGRSPANPVALEPGARLTSSQGYVLDPIVAVRQEATLQPGEIARFDLIHGISPTHDGAQSLAEKMHDQRLADRVFEIAWTHSQVLLQHLRASEPDAQLFARMAGALIYAQPHLRGPASVLSRSRKGQPSLWAYGISGDLPIVLLRITDPSRLDLVRQLVQAHAYWRYKGLRVDLIVLTDDTSIYRQSLHDQIMGVIAGTEAHTLDQPGGIFIRDEKQMQEDDRVLLQACARIFISDRSGALTDQVEHVLHAGPHIPLLHARAKPQRPQPPQPGQMPAGGEALPALPGQIAAVAGTPARPVAAPAAPDLLFFNGLGGFTQDGREYVVRMPPGAATPAPWCNVLANPRLGSVLSAGGSAYTWFENAHEYRLSPWDNDPVAESGGEWLYLRDEETGRFWSTSPLPAPGYNSYTCRHGLGYSIFEHDEEAIRAQTTHFVAVDMPVKFVLVKLQNLSDQPRRLSATFYCELVLGDVRSRHAMHVRTRIDPQTRAIFAQNVFNPEFAACVSFLHAREGHRTYTGDRIEFLGRNGTPAAPAALGRQRLSNKVGPGLDPCAALQVYVDLGPGQQREVLFMLGAGRDENEAHQLLGRLRQGEVLDQALGQVWDHWKQLVDSVHVETPDPQVNVMVNNWLPYQVLASRIWGRSGFYQSGGAFGFRDQLQDAMALVHVRPEVLREQLLRCASRQFLEGDVQHWWHPPSGRGVRTHFSDDYLWMPYAACHYFRVTNDTGVLDESISYLNGRQLGPTEESYYDLPQYSEEKGSFYQHCVRAIQHGLRFGRHGLPLMGCGDWNDGMNQVGMGGQGESVWLAFFLYDVLIQFSEVAQRKGDAAFARHCREQAATLQENIEKHAWDGKWYRRAYFDDGTPLGSIENPECQIDSLPQSWAVISRGGSTQRAIQGLEAVQRFLVQDDLQLIKLFDPPFDNSDLQPGYIRGYAPGVRENGGQYTHAAVWVVMALSMLRQTEQAWRLLGWLLPIQHGDSPAAIARYKVEPYVVAADVYTERDHRGRGGWTWYTGSAGWLYRLIIENLLGLRRENDRLFLTPLVPPSWDGFTVHYRFRRSIYHIHLKVNGPQTWIVRRLLIDGQEQVDRVIHLVDDGREHAVEVELD